MSHGTKLLCLILVLTISQCPLYLQRFNVTSTLSVMNPDGPEVALHLALDDGDFNLTWTSRWETTSQTVQNYSEISGDHVTLNATWNEQIDGGNVTQATLKINDGFNYTTTRPLIQGWLNSVFYFPYDYIDWIQISGISKGETVNITGYAESDCDYFAFPGFLQMEDYDFDLDLLDGSMYTGNVPEHGSFIWNSDSPIMVLGCLNYDDVVGNYTVVVEVGDTVIYSEAGNTIQIDTYWLNQHNDTYQIAMIAKTDLNETYSIMYDNITICNFFEPILTTISVNQLPDSDLSFNISWTCHDNNSDDVNFYSIWLSNNDGFYYMLLVQNLTQTWYVWNSDGWMESTYIARVRAYSVDLSSEDCSLDNPPSSYWPGDFADTFSWPFIAGVNSLPPGYFTLDIDITANHPYYFGSTGNVLEVVFSFSHNPPTSVTYSVNINGSSWFQREYFVLSYTNSFTINIDGLPIGIHSLTVSTGSFTSRSVIIEVLDSSASGTNPSGDSGLLLTALAIGVSIGSIFIMATVVILSIRLKRNQVVEYDAPEPDDSVLELD